MWTSEQLEIRALAREFAAGEIRPGSGRWDANGELDDGVFSALAELGFLGMRVPEEHGGLGLDVGTYLLALEQLAWGDAAVALSVAIHNGPVTELLRRRGSDPQKSALLPGLASGERLGAFALSEPVAGSDPSALETRAERQGDGWRLTGTKRWVTNGVRAGLVVVFARTAGEPPSSEGIGAFLVDPADDGYRAGRRERTMGLSASETVEVQLDGVRVGDDRVIGDPEDGFRYAMEALDMGRAGVAAQAVGIAQAALDHATEYAAGREQFGRPIAEFGGIQEKLAGMATRIAGARALTHRAARSLDGGPDTEHDGPGPGNPTTAAAMAKLSASEAAMWVTDQAVQIYGGYGYMRDYPVEKLLRDAKGTEIYEGTSEILRMLVARDVLRRTDSG